MKNISLQVSGMHCAGCAAGIEKGLLKLNGIKKAQVNFATAICTIEYFGNQIDEHLIIDEISNLGYRAVKGNFSDKDSEAKHIETKNRFLLSLALTIPVIVINMKDMLSLTLPLTQRSIKQKMNQN